MTRASDTHNSFRLFEQALQERGADLTPAERTIAAYMQDNLFFVPFETGASLAAKIGVSEMTIIRFLRSLGYTNLQELKKALRADLMSENSDLDSILERFQLHRRELADDLHDSLELELGAVVAAYDLVATERWQQCVELLAGRASVQVVGNQAVKGTAMDFASRLTYARPGVNFIEGSEGVYVEVLESDPRQTCLVIVDIAPYASKGLLLARKARDLDIPIIFVTDRFNHYAYELSELVLQGDTNIRTFWDSTTALTTILNLLIDSVATRLGAQAQARLRFLRELGGHFGEFESIL